MHEGSRLGERAPLAIRWGYRPRAQPVARSLPPGIAVHTVRSCGNVVGLLAGTEVGVPRGLVLQPERMDEGSRLRERAPLAVPGGDHARA